MGATKSALGMRTVGGCRVIG
ncbi:hypothetical protein RSAG8_05715, partial [Rhizoctonia solani AG-8 WAC10335]